MSQQVILVNSQDQPLGMMDKMQAHEEGILHRAFSIFIFNSKGEMLIQQRADDKYHSAGLWTNACCSHPAPGEETAAAAARRLQEELGFSASLEEIFSFIYRTELENGLAEHEYDHVFTGVYDGPISPDMSEVKNTVHLPLEDIRHSIATHPDKYTVWFRIAFPRVEEWVGRQSWLIGNS